MLNGQGKQLKNFDFTITPLSKFGHCPRRMLPDVRGCIVEVTGQNTYKVKVGEDAFIAISEGGSEEPRTVGDLVWLQYNSWNSNPFWTVKLSDYQDNKYFPIACI